MYSITSMIGKLDYLMSEEGTKGGGPGLRVGFTIMMTISYRIKGDSVTMAPYLTITRQTARRRVWRRVVSALGKLASKPAYKIPGWGTIIHADREDPSVLMMLVEDHMEEILDDLGLQNTVQFKYYDFDAEVSGERITRFITTMAHRMMMSWSMAPERRERLKKLHHVLNVSKRKRFIQLLNVAYGCKVGGSGSSIPYVLSGISLADVAARHPKGYDELLKKLSNVRRVKTSWETSP
jgi:hypothetical protein